ncbi:MAG: peptide ABC transporter substrate-binding protein [Deltaproteobacteria bacterium]|nr:peptide ABC transporter substrate-binding protein [Deltaproteobacteria bacterium]
MRRLVVVLLLVLAMPWSAACRRDAPAAAPRKNRLVVGITQEPDTLWMPMKQMNASEHIGRPGALSLTVFDERWRLIPVAAETIPTVDNGGVVLFDEGGQRRMRVTWRLREGLRWADGAPVTADDFVFTWRLYQDPSIEIVDRTIAERVLDMAAPDARTLVVTWREPYAYYAVFRNHEVLPRHLVEPELTRLGAKLKESPYGAAPTLGGAFTIKEWVPGSHVVAVRNPHAVPAPHLDEIVWRIIPETTTLEANLLAGSIDAISVIGLTFDQALAFAARNDPRFDVVFTPALHWEHLDLNLDNPLLADRRVREALLLALDRQGLVAAVFGGKLEVAHGTRPTGSPYHNAALPVRAHDVARAAALLDEAGFRPGADGVREKDGQPLRLTLVTTAGDKLREQVAQVLVSQWRALGVDVVIELLPAKILFGDTMRHRKFTGLAMFTWSLDPIQVNEAFWRCDQIPREDNGWRGQNFPGFCDARADALLAQIATELDDGKRAAAAQQLEAVLAEALPQLPLYFRTEVSVIPKGFRGWRPVGILQSQAWNAGEWAWPP